MVRQLRLLICSTLLGLCVVCATAFAENRTYDGTGNNLANPTWGVAGTALVRQAPAAYDDGYSTPRGGLLSPTAPNPVLPNPRVVSNTVVAQAAMIPNGHAMTDWVFQWGQFIDHDLDLTTLADPAENFNIAIPFGDPIFDPAMTGTQVMPFQRSNHAPTTGTGLGNPRQQINDITSYLDASMIYGSDAIRANTLREHVGGRLLTSAGNLLPLNTFGLPNGTGGQSADQFYVAGDVRANEQVGLTSVHTLFMREHNRLANQIAAANPGLTDEAIYQRARKLVGAEIQVITFNEFLPSLLGLHAPGINSVYDPNLNAAVMTEFSTALFRVGHTMLPPQLMRIQNDGTEAAGGPMALRHAFFLPQNLAGANELDCFLKGLASDEQQEVDMHIVNDVRNFLFGEPMVGGFDLASLNIQRGRDHGLPGYNAVRIAFGLAPKASFAEISSDPAVQAGLQSLYANVSDIDPWVGALSEDHMPDSQVGELITYGVAEQFRRARDGDRFWFLRDPDLSASDINSLLSLRLSDVIRANTSITNLQANVFFMAVPEPSTIGIMAFLLAVTVPTASGRRRTAP